MFFVDATSLFIGDSLRMCSNEGVPVHITVNPEWIRDLIKKTSPNNQFVPPDFET